MLLSAGTMPGISAERAPVMSSAALSSRGTDFMQAERIGMARLLEQRLDRGLLDLAAGIHDDDPLRRLGDDAEVVGDEDDRRAEPLFRSSMSRRICAWIVTSSAVVGSSASSSLGLHDSAMAIITRWRIPPESWKGYCSIRRSASGMRTRRSISTARRARSRDRS